MAEEDAQSLADLQYAGTWIQVRMDSGVGHEYRCKVQGSDLKRLRCRMGHMDHMGHRDGIWATWIT